VGGGGWVGGGGRDRVRGEGGEGGGEEGGGDLGGKGCERNRSAS